MPLRNPHPPRASQLSRWLLATLLSVGAAIPLACARSTPSTTLPTPDTDAADAEDVDEPAISQCQALEPAPGGAGAVAETTPDPMRCDQDVTRASEPPPPTHARACRALPAEARSSCLTRVRALSRAAAPLRRARAAQSAGEWPAALDGFEAAVALLEDAGASDPGVLGELGWARYRARRWCQDTQDLQELEYQATAADDEAPPVAILCLERVSLDETQRILDQALLLEMSDARRAMLLYNLAHVLAAQGDSATAADSLRESLCLREHPSVRAAYAEQLWNDADQATRGDLDLARQLYRQSLVVLPDPDRARHLAALEEARSSGFQLVAAGNQRPTVYPHLGELCRALLSEILSDPLDEDEEVDACEVSEWTPVGREGEPPWSVASMRLISPELNDGVFGAHFLLARAPAGVSVLIELGYEHGDSRTENSYVDQITIEPTPELPWVAFSTSWVSGTAYADGCNWGEEASRRVSLCGWDAGAARCFATGVLGPVEYTSDTMLATIQESLGNCEEPTDLLLSPLGVSAFAPTFGLSLERHEIVADRESDGSLTCLPLRETLCGLETRPSVGCPE